MALVKRTEKLQPISAEEYDAVVTQVEENQSKVETIEGAIETSEVIFSVADEAAMTAKYNSEVAAGRTPIDGKEQIFRKDLNEFWEWDSSETSKGKFSRENFSKAADNQSLEGSTDFHTGNQINTELIVKNQFIQNADCGFIKELYITGWTTENLHLRLFNEDDNGGVTFQFKNADNGDLLIYSYQRTQGLDIYELKTTGDANGSGFGGYLVVDWSKYTTVFNSGANYVAPVNEKAKYLGNSPFIKGYLDSQELDNVKEALRVPPTYVQPSASITNVSQTVEKGTTLTDLDVNISFTQNDAGSANGYSLEQDGVEIYTTQNNTLTLSNITNSIVFQGFVSYDDGAVKNDNFNEPNDTGQILAGTKESGTRTITPRLYVFYGSTANSSVDSDDVRALNKLFDNRTSITLSTGTTNTIFEVAVSSTKTTASSLSAQDTTNNISLTYNFDRLITVNLPTGTQEYRIYKLTIGSAYPTSANHVIQL